jgi:putative ABC transport system ATP-binding protein
LIVETKDLTKIYRIGSSKIIAVNNVDLRVKKGTFISIFGPSGSGKTTLLNLIGLIDKPTSGKVFFNQIDTTALGDNERRKIRLFHIGFVFQTFNLLPQFTVIENIEVPMSLLDIPTDEQRKRALKLLEAVGLEKRKNHLPKQLSVGEMQRVAIARALANNPIIILADEPTGELDSKTGAEIVNLLNSLCQEKDVAIIVATHDERITKKADIVYRMHDGMLKKC